MYRCLKPILFCFPPETAHKFTLRALKILHQLKLTCFLFPTLPPKSVNVFGLSFKNPVGIAAGLDKNGDYLDCLAALGVGFIEVGAVTPVAQIGNPKPRLFRLKEKHALINRMGFNNKGIDYLVENLKKRKTGDCLIGVNLGKNKDTPLEKAQDDYIICLRKIYPYADFMTINISSPNTPGLRELQQENHLENLLQLVKHERDALATQHHKRVPLLVKIAPDLSQAEVRTMLQSIVSVGMDGIIATNTTQARDAVQGLKHAGEIGGLSGPPVKELSYQVLQCIREIDQTIPVISVGGIDSVQEAERRFKAGTQLVQLYTSLIYQGPYLLRKIIKYFRVMP